MDKDMRIGMRRTLLAVFSAAAAGLAATPLAAQNLISQGGWEGFAMRQPDGRFDRCVLYNRTVPALNASPYGMIGLTRDGSGYIGLMVFFEPRTLTRAAPASVRMRIDEEAPMSLSGEAVSDFHVVIPSPLDSRTVAAMRNARKIEFSTDAKTIRLTVADMGTDMGAVLDRLKTCVETYAH
jgi:hypothetical protein